MPRELYVSEKKIMSTIALNEWGINDVPFSKVVSEFHDAPQDKKRQLFNLDFEYEFFHGDYPQDKIKSMVPSLPQILGSDVYYFAYSQNYMPIILVFLGGAGFPIKHYKKYIDEVEAAIQSAIGAKECWNPHHDQLAKNFEKTTLDPGIFKKCKPLGKHRFLRIMVIYDTICFLSFTKDDRPIPCGTRYRLMENDSQCIDCFVADNEMLCFDGWLRTTPPIKSEWKLIATKS